MEGVGVSIKIEGLNCTKHSTGEDIEIFLSISPFESYQEYHYTLVYRTSEKKWELKTSDSCYDSNIHTNIENLAALKIFIKEKQKLIENIINLICQLKMDLKDLEIKTNKEFRLV